MKKLIIFATLLLLFTALSGCKPEIYIEPDAIAVVYDNPRYQGTSFFMDVYITNGFETEEFVGYMEFDIYTDDSSTYVAGAGFDINETIPGNNYILIELEFESEFVFTSESDFNESGYNLERLELFFWYEE